MVFDEQPLAKPVGLLNILGILLSPKKLWASACARGYICKWDQCSVVNAPNGDPLLLKLTTK